MQNIQAKLGSAFGKKGDIDEKLKVCTSTVLSQRIEFQEGSRPHTCLTEMLKGKYINLVPASSVATITSETSSGKDGEGLQQPAQILFPPEKLDYSWRHQEGGAGFMNCGNTCFLNATLQCIVHTPPLANYMMSGEHAKGCHVVHSDKCILCNLEFITKRSLTGVADSFSPKWFINNLQYIGRHFRNGRQEDAHEFLRLSLEKMQKCALIGHGQLDKYSKETTVINQIFGGFLRSQVLCLKCNARSNTYDPLLDISLDIRNVDSIEKAFEVFVAPDKLEMENAYKCDKCKQKVSARKRFSIHKQPNVLTIQLKRFQYAQAMFYGGGGKISKPIKYPAKLDIRPYMSNKNGPPEFYKLFATIQHEGYSCNSGHYVANVRCGQTWFHFNDSVRRQTSLQQCLNEPSAYILFYMKDISIEQTVMQKLPFEMSKQQKQVKDVSVSSMQPIHKFIGPMKPIQMKPAGFKTQTVTGSSLNNGTLVKPPLTPLLANREKISFELKSQVQFLTTPLKSNLVSNQQRLVPNVKPVLLQQTATDPCKQSLVSPQKQNLIMHEDIQTPRFVMKITDGKSVTVETSPDGKRKIVADEEEVVSKVNGKKHKHHSKKSGLVPYENESTSDSDGSSEDATRKAISTMQEPMKQSLSSAEKDGIVFDQKLNTTTSVPGNTHLYGTVTMKDKLNHLSPDRPKEWKTISPKPAVSNQSNRLLGETLSCVTANGAIKQAGSSDWHTREESILSPSIGSSHSSTHSSNSTNEWTVLPNGFKSCSNRTVAGWTVTPAKPENAQPKSVSCKSVNGSCAKSTAEVQEVHDKHLRFSPNEATNDGLCLLSSYKMNDGPADEYKSYKKLKKHKKHKKHKNEDRDFESGKGSDDCSSSLHKKKKKKKHKHSSHEDRKERKHEKEKYVLEHESQHKHRDMEDHQDKVKVERELENRSKQKHADNIKVDRHLKSKYEARNDDERIPKPEVARQHSDSEFVWVEKTVPEPRKPSKSASVTPCQKWDHYVKDGYKRKATASESSTTPITPAWDGLKTAKIVNQLENVSHCGYGAPVLAWSGHKSQLDIERENDKAYSRKRTLEDNYNNEYDCGRVKKVKHKHQDEFSRLNGNVFQYEQDKRNKYKTKWSNIKIGSNNPSIHHKFQNGGGNTVNTFSSVSSF